jgi:hypothetical protein
VEGDLEEGDDRAIDFSAEFGAFGFVGYSVFVGAESDFLGEVVEG